MDQGRRKVAQLPVHSIRLFSVSRMHWCQRFCWFLRRQIRNDGENAMIQGAVDALNVSLRQLGAADNLGVRFESVRTGSVCFVGETEYQWRAGLGESRNQDRQPGTRGIQTRQAQPRSDGRDPALCLRLFARNWFRRASGCYSSGFAMMAKMRRFKVRWII